MTIPPEDRDRLHEELHARRERLREFQGLGIDGARIASLLDEVDAALGRLEGGGYGRCQSCAGAIESERLLVCPETSLCLDCLGPEERRALEYDIERAASIHAALMPPSAQRFPGWEVVHHNRPAGTVSGDFCDVIPSPEGDGALTVFLGDVSGKGISAAMLVSHLLAVLRGLVREGLPLVELVESAGRMLCESTLPQHFATLLAMRAAPDGSVELVSAGHHGPLVLDRGRASSLPVRGLPLGMFCCSCYETAEIVLEPGSALLLTSDGVLDAENGAGEHFGAARLADGLAGPCFTGAAEILAATLDNVSRFSEGRSLRDDLSVLVLRRT